MPYPPGAVPGTSDTLRYDQLTSIACHNCYNPAVRIGRFTDALAYTTDLELDAYPLHGGAGFDVAHDRKAKSLHRNNCQGWHPRRLWKDRPRPPADLAACLHEVRSWMDAHRDAPVITLFVDLKEGDWSHRWPLDLDAVLRQGLGGYLFTPGDLVSRGGPGARLLPGEAARAGMWPRLGELRGRVVVVLTGGEDEPWRHALEAPGNKLLRTYAERRKLAAQAFVAPDVASAGQIAGAKPSRAAENAKAGALAPVDFEDAPAWAAFYNYLPQFRSRAVTDKVGRAGRGAGAVVRTWLLVEVFPRQAYCSSARVGIQRMASRRFFKDRLCSIPSSSPADTP